ncbi:chalcone-flavanone isomerase-domain-containing protein [Polychytrium aggregatum]|uniref:chalcone-flavanone isomerase-domain-containing protein n=1 Tax=Polychytrium aggregatum TaxID=110093 RepID=UPI0022FE0F64|nr:chalcone-flavanone isomerase-domain-containing protein [Polychytrium aggregatum]KAI9199726.1 chalcone-flavanone isomerase-domain-containing protein [Polychytrium aggregatum]
MVLLQRIRPCQSIQPGRLIFWAASRKLNPRMIAEPGLRIAALHSSPLQLLARPRSRSSLWAYGTGLLLVLSAALAGGSVLNSEQAHPIPLREDPVTHARIPESLRLPSRDPQQSFRLLGLGSRHVTFLQIPVYVIGVYIDSVTEHAISTWKAFDAEAFLKHNVALDHLVKGKGQIAIRIEPTRATNGPHLRNGVERFLKLQLAQDQASLTETELQEIKAAMTELRANFPPGVVKAGQSFVFRKTTENTLEMEFEGELMVVMKSKWVAETFIAAYLRADPPISEKTRVSVADGLQKAQSGAL